MRLLNRVTFHDVKYDNTTQDFAISGGDIQFVSTHTEIVDQLLIDAVESTFNSMRHIMRNWGFEGRDDDYVTIDNVVRQKLFMYMGEIINVLDPFYINVVAVSPTFTATGWDMRIELVLSDLAGSTYDKTLSWNQTTQRGSIT